MKFTETELAGAFIVDLARHEDDRGTSLGCSASRNSPHTD